MLYDRLKRDKSEIFIHLSNFHILKIDIRQAYSSNIYW